MRNDGFKFEKIDLEQFIESLYKEFKRLYPNPLKLQNDTGPLQGFYDKEALTQVVNGLLARVMGAVGIRKEIVIEIENLQDTVRILVGSSHALMLHLTDDINNLPVAHALARAHGGKLYLLERESFRGYCLELQKILKV